MSGKNTFMQNALQLSTTLLASSSLFFPANFPYKDVITEGIYGLSKLMNLFTETKEWMGSDLSEVNRLVCRSIGCLEVFLELLAGVSLPALGINFIILTLETLKCLSRILLLYSEKEYIMLLAWDRGGQRSSLREYYEQYLKQFVHKLKSISSSLHFSKLNETDRPSISTKCDFVGRRSGLIVKYHSGLSSAVDWKIRQEKLNVQRSSLANQLQEEESLATEHQFFETPVKPLNVQSSPVCSATNLSEEFPDQDISQVLDSNMLTTSPATFLLVGETLYILKPFVYALLIHALQENTETQLQKFADRNVGIRRVFSPLAFIKQSLEFRWFVLLVSFLIEFVSLEISKYALRLTRLDAHKFALLHLPQILKAFGNADATRDLKESIVHVYESQRDLITASIESTTAFDQEIKRRQFALFFYLVRSPLFDRATLPAIRGIAKFFQPIPLFHLIPEQLAEILIYINKRHFYHSNS